MELNFSHPSHTIGDAVSCPLCRKRKVRRACPALRSDICSFCCGTKRLTEIQCPKDCPYLSAAREHPPAAFVRQQQHDIALLLQYMRDFSEGQSQLFLMAGTFLAGYQPPELHALLDEDVAGAAAALAATYETAAHGVDLRTPAGVSCRSAPRRSAETAL